MAEVATKTNKDVSKALGTEAKNASKVMTAVAGGKKGVVSYAKDGIRTAKKVRQYYKGEYIAGTVTGVKPTLKTGTKHLVHEQVMKGKVKISEGKIALYKASAGDYSDIVKGTVKGTKKTVKSTAKVGAKVTKLQSEAVKIQEDAENYLENKSKEMNSRIATKPVRITTKTVTKELDRKIGKPLRDKSWSAVKNAAKKSLQTTKKLFSAAVEVGKSAISLILAFPVLLIPIFFLILISCIGGAGGYEYEKTNVTPAEGWLFPAKENKGINAGTWSYPGGGIHLGIDLTVTSGEPLLAVADGYILRASDGCKYGYLGSTCHGEGGSYGGGNEVMLLVPVQDKLYAVKYCHMQPSLPVKTGETVKAGDVIGYAGATGNASGVHCHIEITLVGNADEYSNYINTWSGDWSNGAGWQGKDRKCSESVQAPCRVRPEIIFGLEKGDES